MYDQKQEMAEEFTHKLHNYLFDCSLIDQAELSTSSYSTVNIKDLN